MTSPENLCGCGAKLDAAWKVCPFCGRKQVDPVVLARLVGQPVKSFSDPLATPPPAATQQFERDQSIIGFGLIALGVLGFMGGCGLLFSGSLTKFGSLDTLVAVFLVGGGATVAAVIVGTTIISHNMSARDGASSGILGGLLAGFMALGVCGLTVFAMIIYAVETCLNGCK